MPFRSEEGEQQGDPIASMVFCAGIHPEVVAADTDIRGHGGMLVMDMDDGYIAGPTNQVFRKLL